MGRGAFFVPPARPGPSAPAIVGPSMARGRAPALGVSGGATIRGTPATPGRLVVQKLAAAAVWAGSP